MKYYLIAGEASGDLHAAQLMRALTLRDSDAEFRFFGGDEMLKEGGTLVRHYKDTAFMGFLPVLLHLPTILRNLRLAKDDILRWRPDAVILVDYAGFNLKVAKHVHTHTDIPVYYYISPKVWAWKEGRVKTIKCYVDRLFSILPFEKHFYEERHHYPIHYVGNPTKEEVLRFKAAYHETFADFCARHGLQPEKPVIAVLAGSRRQEIAFNLPAMLKAGATLPDCQMVIAGAPSFTHDDYAPYLQHTDARLIENDTYALLSHATAAMVTSGTATLETALFRVPQVVCYKTRLPHLVRWAFRHILKVPYISLVNLIAGKDVVRELLANEFTVENITEALHTLLPGRPERDTMLAEYDSVDTALGNLSAPEETVRLMVEMLSQASH